MRLRQIIGVLALLASVALAALALTMPPGEGDLSVTDSSGLGVSQLVGKLLLPLILAMVGAWLLQRRSTRKE
jgi:hypothetical protein